MPWWMDLILAVVFPFLIVYQTVVTARKQRQMHFDMIQLAMAVREVGLIQNDQLEREKQSERIR